MRLSRGWHDRRLMVYVPVLFMEGGMKRVTRDELELMLGVFLRVVPQWVRRAYAGKTPDEQDRGAEVLAAQLAQRLERFQIHAPRPDEAADTHPPTQRQSGTT